MKTRCQVIKTCSTSIERLLCALLSIQGRKKYKKSKDTTKATTIDQHILSILFTTFDLTSKFIFKGKVPSNKDLLCFLLKTFYVLSSVHKIERDTKCF